MNNKVINLGKSSVNEHNEPIKFININSRLRWGEGVDGFCSRSLFHPLFPKVSFILHILKYQPSCVVVVVVLFTFCVNIAASPTQAPNVCSSSHSSRGALTIKLPFMESSLCATLHATYLIDIT